MLARLKNILCPTLEKYDQTTLNELKERESSDIEEINSLDWGLETNLALEEARRLYIEEDERRGSAESKASNLLLVASALIPLITYFENLILGGDKEPYAWGYILIFIIAMFYFLAASYWAFKVVSVGNYYRVYPIDITRLWKNGKEVSESLVVELLTAVRLNQERINDKLSYFKMAQEYIFRAVIAFSILLLMRVSYSLWGFSIEPIHLFFSFLFQFLGSVFSEFSLFILSLRDSA
tara:strand:- start:276 stop:986 length:711 start_codon:yes stop_codon:yes gene_type:complete